MISIQQNPHSTLRLSYSLGRSPTRPSSSGRSSLTDRRPHAPRVTPSADHRLTLRFSSSYCRSHTRPQADPPLPFRHSLASQPMADRPHAVPSLPFFRLAPHESRSQNNTAVSCTADHPTRPLSPTFTFPALASLGYSLSERWAGPIARRGERRRRTSRYTTTARTNEQPPTPPDTHVTSNYRTTWLNMHLMGGSGLILYLITHEGAFPQQ